MITGKNGNDGCREAKGCERNLCHFPMVRLTRFVPQAAMRSSARRFSGRERVWPEPARTDAEIHLAAFPSADFRSRRAVIGCSERRAAGEEETRKKEAKDRGAGGRFYGRGGERESEVRGTKERGRS